MTITFRSIRTISAALSLAACSEGVLDARDDEQTSSGSALTRDNAPLAVRLTAIDDTSFRIDWSNTLTDATGLRIEMRTPATKTWKTTISVPLAKGQPLPTSFVLTAVKPCAIFEVRVVALARAKAYPSTPASLSSLKNRMWVWPSPGPDGDLTQASVRSAIISWATSHSVDTLYVSAYQLLQVQNDPVTLATFVNDAYQAGVGVMLEYGDPAWSNPGHWAGAHTKVQTAVDFVLSQGAYITTGLPAAQRLGVVIDSEAWVSSWQGGAWGTVAADWLTMLADLRTVIHGSATTNPNHLRFAVAIASWLDTSATSCPPNPPNGCTVTWNAQSKLLSDHVVDLADGTVIMAYAQSASSIQSRATSEVARGSLRCRRQDVGVETGCPVDSSSFCGLTQSTLNSAMTSVRSGFAGQYGFGGIAIDKYSSWSAMTP